MVMVIFSLRWNGDGFSPSPSMVFGGINYWQRWFFDGFPILRDQWSTMVTEEEKRVFWDNLQENWKAISSMTLKYFTTNSHSWHTHIIFQVCNPKTNYQTIFWKLLFVFLLQLDRKVEIYVQLPKINGFEDHHCYWWNGISSTIGTNGFSMVFQTVNHRWRWFLMVATIGPTMRW